MKIHPHLIHPLRCFCQIPLDELRFWVEKRYLQGIPTIELLNSTEDAHEKEVITIVSLFDVDEETMLQQMGGVDMPLHHIVYCREDVRILLGLIREENL